MDAIKRIGIVFFIFFTSVLYAEPLKNNNNPYFDVNEADAQLDNYSERLKNHDFNAKQVNSAINTVEGLIDDAKECVAESNGELKEIDDLKKLISVNSPVLTKTGEEYKKYIDEKETLYSEYVSDCQLFIVRSMDALNELEDTLQKFNKSELVAHTLSIKELINSNWTALEWERLVMLGWVTLLGISVACVACALVRWIAKRYHHANFYPPLRFIIITLTTVMIIMELAGFHNLTVYLSVNSLISVLYTSIAILFIKLIQQAIFQLNNNQPKWAQTIRYYLGLKPYHKIPELLVAKVAVFISLLAILVVVILKTWGMSNTTLDNVILGLTDKLYLAGLEIHPLSVVSAMLVFSALIISGRYLSAYVSRHQQFSEKKDTQVAMAALMSYFIFSVAFVVALVMAGFNMTGLAIVAGALSVGIGLGLQNIVNNFVAGVILLLEKPIKPGDRIMIGATEGFVKKIRVRSTQITTTTKEDVIIPNSDLITHQVTNYMFRDKTWCVVSRVGVAYGSDVELVRKVLLDIAKNNPDVMQEAPHDPAVFFKSFADSSLNFELWSYIFDVNKKSVVASDLNFAIEKAFRKHGIVIAFPQQDIHIIDWPAK